MADYGPKLRALLKQAGCKFDRPGKGDHASAIQALDELCGEVGVLGDETPNGVAEVPLTELAVAAFSEQMKIAGDGEFVFPSEKNPLGHQTTFKTAWAATRTVRCRPTSGPWSAR